jgi:hypothetical protein
MRRKSRLVATMAASLLVSMAFAATGEELKVRGGVVTAMQAAPATPGAVSATTRRQLGGMLGRALGQAVGGRGTQSYEITRAVGNLGADIAAGEGDAGTAGNYLLTVRFDDASESAFVRNGGQLARIRIGSRVKVIGSGEAATLLAE